MTGSDSYDRYRTAQSHGDHTLTESELDGYSTSLGYSEPFVVVRRYDGVHGVHGLTWVTDRERRASRGVVDAAASPVYPATGQGGTGSTQ